MFKLLTSAWSSSIVPKSSGMQSSAFTVKQMISRASRLSKDFIIMQLMLEISVNITTNDRLQQRYFRINDIEVDKLNLKVKK